MASGRKIALSWQAALIEYKSDPELKEAVERITARDLELGSPSDIVSGALAQDFVVRWMLFGDLLPDRGKTTNTAEQAAA